jgi:hypothetical protein
MESTRPCNTAPNMVTLRRCAKTVERAVTASKNAIKVKGKALSSVLQTPRDSAPLETKSVCGEQTRLAWPTRSPGGPRKQQCDKGRHRQGISRSA